MNDKVLHFIVGTVIAVIAGLLISPWAALPVAVLAGSIKEFYDSFYPNEHTVDPFDFIATGLGGLLGAMIVLITLYYEITVVLLKYLLNTY